MIHFVVSFVLGAFVFTVDALILYALIASAFRQNNESQSQGQSGSAAFVMLLLIVCKTFFLLSSLYICFKFLSASPLPFVLGSSFSLIAFVCFMHFFHNKPHISAKNQLNPPLS